MYRGKPIYYKKKIVVPFKHVHEANRTMDLAIIHAKGNGFVTIEDLYNFAYNDHFECNQDERRYGWVAEDLEDAAICCLPGGRCFIEMPKCVLL